MHENCAAESVFAALRATITKKNNTFHMCVVGCANFAMEWEKKRE
jgi:hypothetical protein